MLLLLLLCLLQAACVHLPLVRGTWLLLPPLLLQLLVQVKSLLHLGC
jgi:hypothetical protein